MLVMKKTSLLCVILVLLVGPPARAASIEDVTFLTRIEVYETIAGTTLVTQEGKRIPLDKGTRVNVAGFTETEALVVSRSDRPNGFIKKSDLAPSLRPNLPEPPRIKEETLPRSNKSPEEGTR
jgi:hypothetical protein